jgi:hypothetical protein
MKDELNTGNPAQPFHGPAERIRIVIENWLLLLAE